MTETLKKLNVSDYGVALYILAAVMFMIVPIPSWLLDIMLAFNISVALVVMMNCLRPGSSFPPASPEMSSSPSVSSWAAATSSSGPSSTSS